MRLPVLATWASAVALVAASLPLASATADPVDASPSSAPAAQPAPEELHDHDEAAVADATAPSATQLLAEARALFEPVPAGRAPRARAAATTAAPRDASMTLTRLQLQRSELPADQRAEVKRLTARPTGSDHYFNYPSGAKVKNTCTKKVCVHWPPTQAAGTEAERGWADSNADGVPDQVDTTMAVMQELWTRIVSRGGYSAPKKDKGAKARPKQGPNRKFDVYLANLARFGLYGYCTIDPTPMKKVKRQGWDLPAYCVLDDDFNPSDYNSSKTALQLLRVTAAHEFFHAVQFAHDVNEDIWLMEGTAAWIEDEIYDDVNDNLSFLKYSQAVDRFTPLDFGPPTDHARGMYAYGSWIWWRYLSERFPQDKGSGLPVIVRDVWRKADASASNPKKRGTYSVRAVQKVLKKRKTNVTKVYADFGEALRRPSVVFDEGAGYPQIPLIAAWELTAAQPGIPEQVAKMPHLTNYTVGFRPGAGIANGWKLKVKVDGPPKKRGSFAQATIHHAGGGQSVKTIKLDKKGRGARTLPFGSDAVTRIELTLTNAGVRYKCNRGTVYACAGKSKDNGAKFFLAARAQPGK